jgi:sugar lactone lactonase YvrE
VAIVGVAVITTAPFSSAARPRLNYGQTIGSGGELKDPNGVAVDASGDIYVADGAHNRIVKFSSTGTVLASFGSLGSGPGQFNSPLAINIDHSGNIYVADSGNRRLVKLTADGTFIREIGSFGTGQGQFNQVDGVATDQAGNVYVTSDSNRVQKFDTNGNFLLQWGGVSGGGDGQFADIQGVRVTPSGYVVIVDQAMNAVQTFDTSGTFISKRTFAHGSSDGQVDILLAVDVDSSDNIYVTDAGGRVQKFDSNGNFLASAGAWSGPLPHLTYPNDVVVTSDGKVIVADYGTASLVVYSQQLIDAATSVVALSASEVSYNEAALSWQAPTSDGGDPISGYLVYTRQAGQEGWTLGPSLDASARSATVSLNPSTSYEAKVVAVNYAGEGLPATVSFATVALPPHVVSSVSFETVNGQKRMVLQGHDLIYSAYDYYDGWSHSLVNLNGTPLPFCASPYTTDELIGYGVDATLFSDHTPCYQFEDQDYNPLFTKTQVVIELPDSFDTTAEGIVSVNGSDAYTFNHVSPPTQPAIVPSIRFNNTALSEGPTLSQRPTFSGTAEPGSTVTVTVHSDPVVCTATADGAGNWSCQLPTDLPAGAHQAYYAIRLPNGSTQNYGPYAVTVATSSSPSSVSTNGKTAAIARASIATFSTSTEAIPSSTTDQGSLPLTSGATSSHSASHQSVAAIPQRKPGNTPAIWIITGISGVAAAVLVFTIIRRIR